MNRQTRRAALLGGAAAIVFAGGAAYEWQRLSAQRFKGPYGDLVAKLPDAKAAAAVGRAVPNAALVGMPDRVDTLRQRLSDRSLETVLQQDMTKASLIEARGWVLPDSLGLLCVLAARTI